MPNSHQQAAELHDAAAHAHRIAGLHRQQDHLSGSEQSRQALEHSRAAHRQTHAVPSFGHAEIARRAHELWQARGRPHGSPQLDWFQASEELRGIVRR
jgi:hypothetical protein